MKYIITFLTCITMGLTADGKLGGVTYFDFLSADDSTAFNFQRQYFSYAIEISDNIKFNVVFDVGRTNIGTVLDKEDAEKKAAKEREAKERAAAIDDVKKEILFLGETPFPEYEFSTEDKYIAALRQQIEDIKKQKEEEELKINAEIPEWYSNMPKGSETIMYSRGTHISVDLDQSETIAIENAVVKLALNLQRRTDAKLDIIAREAGVDGDLTLKQEFKTISKSVAKQASITGYKVYNTKMAPIANGKFRTFIVIEFPISLAYKAYLANIENNPAIKDKLSKLKDTEAYKELEEIISEFTGA